MPATYFKCPANGEIPIAECLNKCPNPQGRCLSLPTLYAIGYNRTHSTWKCLNCGLVIPSHKERAKK